MLSLVAIKIHQATVGEDLALVGREVLEQEVKVVDAVAGNDLGVDFLLALKDGLSEAGDEDAVALLVGEGCAFGKGEGYDAPVDAV